MTGAGLGGSGGSAGGGKTDVKKSAGCGVSASQTLGQYVESMVMTGGANRPYSVRLPTAYDPTRAYPGVVLLHGCGSGTNNVAMEKSTGADAILIREPALHRALVGRPAPMALTSLSSMPWWQIRKRASH